VVKWNGGTSFPIQSGHPCIGCTEKHFFDRMTPFYSTLPTVPGVGVEATANEIGAVALGAALLGVCAHAAGSAIGLRRERMKEDAVVSLPVLGDGGDKKPEDGGDKKPK